MASPTQLSILLTGSGGTIVIPIPQALQTLNSAQDASTQTGYSAADQAIRSIFRAGVFTDGQGKWYAASQIASITAS